MPRPPRRTLYLHIGVHRTGTTSIQRFLKTNHDALIARGYLHPYGVARHFRTVNALFRGDLDPAGLAADLDSRARTKAQPIHSVILSDEDICTRADLDPIRRLTDCFDVRIVLALRRQDLWLESWFRQNVKWQWNADLAHLSLEEFLERRTEFFWIDYESMADRLESLFGADALSLLVFEPGQMPDGPVAAFTRAIGIGDLSGFGPLPVVNRSLSALTTEYMRTLPLDEIHERYRRLIEQACTRMDWYVKQHYGQQSTLLMDAGTRAGVLAEYAAGNAALARRRFGREALFLEPLPPSDAPLAPQQLPGDVYEVMQVFTANFLRALASASMEEIRAGKDQTGPGRPAGV